MKHKKKIIFAVVFFGIDAILALGAVLLAWWSYG